MEKIKWTPEMMLEVELVKEDSFLIVMETLQRMGMVSIEGDKKTLYQSCHILHKQGRYYILHFREMYALDGKEMKIPVDDITRRNGISKALSNWGIIRIPNSDFLLTEETCSLDRIRIISHKEKEEWNLKTMYKMGNKK